MNNSRYVKVIDKDGLTFIATILLNPSHKYTDLTIKIKGEDEIFEKNERIGITQSFHNKLPIVINDKINTLIKEYNQCMDFQCKTHATILSCDFEERKLTQGEH